MRRALRATRNPLAFIAICATVLATYDVSPASAWATGDVSRILITNEESGQDNGCLNSGTATYGNDHDGWVSNWNSYPCTDGYNENYIGLRLLATRWGDPCYDSGYSYNPNPANYYGIWGGWCGYEDGLETTVWGAWYDWSLSNYQYPSQHAYSANHQ
jgi:hypothetical protein